jgi:diguanylate cyclase (GGDEF)-like protein
MSQSGGRSVSEADSAYALPVAAFANLMSLVTALSVAFYVFFTVIDAGNALTGSLVLMSAVLVGWLLIYKSEFKMSALVAGGALLFTTFWFITFSGGFHSPFLIWLSCPPLIVGLLVNWRWSILAWSSVLLFVLVIMSFHDYIVSLSEFPVVHTSEMTHGVSFVSVISAVSTVIFFSLQNHRVQISHLKDAQIKERTDSLTGVLNRSGFNRAIAALSKSTDASGALIMFDVDEFKKINDTHGHLFGDYVLQKIALKAGGVIREGDTFARIGGDEFAVILPNSSHVQAAGIGRRIKQAVDDFTFESLDGEKVRVEVSVGVATCEDSELCQTELMMHLADTALYEAKDIRQRVAVKRLEQFKFVESIRNTHSTARIMP